METKTHHLLGAVLTLLVTVSDTRQISAAGQAQMAPPAQADGPEFVEGELLVGFRPGAAATHVEAVRNGLGAAKVKAWPEIDAEHWRLPRGFGVGRAIQALSNNPNVLYAEPNYIVHADEIPNDPLRANLWGLHNIGQSGGTVDADIDAPEAWDVQHDASSVVVAVIDSGIDPTHPDLVANMWRNSGESGTDSQGRDKATNGVDDDGNGYVDDRDGWDFINGDNNPFDDNSHGTHVAGTIGAVGNNGVGVAGVAWRVQLMPLKILDLNGSGPLSATVSALLYAGKFVDSFGNKLVRISNNSYGSGSTKSKAVESAIKNFLGLFMASAGNSATSTEQYPAGYDLANIISVARTDRNDQLASTSNYGSWVDIAAPGSDILSTVPGGGYGLKSGTSMAAPHVSGVAALLLAQNPGWTVGDLKGQIVNAVDVLPVLAGKVSSGGRLNARKALGADEFQMDTTPPAAITDLAVASSELTSITLTWSAPGIPGVDSPAYYYLLRYGTTPITDANFGAGPQSLLASAKAPGESETFTVGWLSIASTYYFAIKAYDLAGNPSPISNIASGTTLDNDWRFLTVSPGYNVANTVGAVRNESGGWTFVSDDDGNLRFLNYISGNGYYNLETIAPISGGASVAYDLSWTPTVSYIASGKLYFAQKIAGTWSISTVETRNIPNGDTTSTYDSSGAFWNAYPKGGGLAGLYAARKVGANWTVFSVERNGDGIYNQIALAPDGRPSIAYADDTTDDGKGDLLKLSHFNGTSWTISTVDTVASGPVSLTYAPDGSAAIASRSGPNNELRFYLSTPSGWFSEAIDSTVPIQSCSIAVHSDATVWIAYATLTDMRAAKRDPVTGLWTTMLIDPTGPGTCRTAMYVGPTSGRPLVLYGTSSVTGYTDGLRYAVKNTP